MIDHTETSETCYCLWYGLCRWNNEIIKSSNEVSLFSLNGVSRGHIIAGDVAFLPRVDGASLPPVSFSAGGTMTGKRTVQLRTDTHMTESSNQALLMVVQIFRHHPNKKKLLEMRQV